MEKYKVVFKESDKKLTEKEIEEVRSVMADIIARYIVKNRK